ncbi:MAG: hypothetical protein ACE5GE_01905, partial [Phycisphaerae bacterium]
AEPVAPPAPVARWVSHLPAADYDAVFCRQPTRSVIMALSGAVLAAALCLCPPRRHVADDRPGATA